MISINDILKEQVELWEKINSKIELSEEEKQKFNENKIIIGNYTDYIICQGDKIE